MKHNYITHAIANMCLDCKNGYIKPEIAIKAILEALNGDREIVHEGRGSYIPRDPDEITFPGEEEEEDYDEYEGSRDVFPTEEINMGAYNP